MHIFEMCTSLLSYLGVQEEGYTWYRQIKENASVFDNVDLSKEGKEPQFV